MRRRDAKAILGLAALLAVLSACGSVGDSAAIAEIAPTSPEVWPGDTVTFVAKVAGTVDEATEWSVIESDGGTIDANGGYTAPETEGTYTVQASLTSGATELTTVRVKRNLRVAVTPQAATLAPGESLALSSAVSGPVKDVTWSVTDAPAGGTVTSAGVYTAPQGEGVYTVVATSAADSTRSASATITVIATPPPPQYATATATATVSVSVAPQALSITAGSTVQFTATVSGSTDVGVTWSVAQTGGGTVNPSGLYSAPLTAGTYQIVATSNADSSMSAASTVTVTPAIVLTGTQFYVSTSGNDANPGTLSQPWRTIQKAMTSATPGSTVNIRGGTYQETLVMNVSGSAGNYITFQNYGYRETPGGVMGGAIPGEQVVVNLSYLGTVTNGSRFFAINGRQYITIRGITWRGHRAQAFGPARGFWIEGGAHHIEVRDCKFLDNKDTGGELQSAYAHIYFTGSANNITFYGNEIGNVVTNASEPLTATGANVFSILIENNYVHDVDQLAIAAHHGAHDVVIRGNVVEYVSWTRNSTLYWPGRSSAALYCAGCNNTVFENNIVRNTSWGIQILSEPTDANAFNVTARNNLFLNCGNGQSAAILIGSWYAGKSDSGVHIYNNTIYNSRIGAYQGPHAVANQTFRNNIFAFNGTNVINGAGFGTWGYNVFWSGGTYAGDAMRTDANPLFVNAGASDLRLQPDSPAINRGDPGTSSTFAGSTDHAGNARILGGRIDAGAFELN